MIGVIVSYWAARSPRCLYRLLDQIYRYDAGAEFTVTVVCNGGDIAPLELPARHARRGVKALNRQNAGYNIAAWDFGWRSDCDSDHFLFLQDECLIRNDGWLRAFVDAMEADPRLGLLGENINWRCSWDVQRNNPIAARCLNRDGEEPFNSVDFLREFIDSLGIPSGNTAEHLQSLVLFSSRQVLETIDGFASGSTYAEAVGTEIAISKAVQAHGYRIAMVGDRPFSSIGHRQWTDEWYKRWIRLKLFLRPYKGRLEQWLARQRG